jgi:type IV secretion system protein VirB9
MTPPFRKAGGPGFRKSAVAALLLSVSALAGCATQKPPEISYDAEVPPLPAVPAVADGRPRPLHIPPSWTPSWRRSTSARRR